MTDPPSATPSPKTDALGADPVPPEGGNPARGRRGRRFWAVVIVGIVLLLLLPTWVFGYLPTIPGPAVVRVSEYCGGNLESLSFDYAGPQHGYLFRASNDSPQYCSSVEVAARSTYSTDLTLHNADPTNAHTVESVAIAAPFALAGTSPSLPAAVREDTNLSIQLTIQVPGFPGTYGLPSAIVYAS
jgi:hypothetical protein